MTIYKTQTIKNVAVFSLSVECQNQCWNKHGRLRKNIKGRTKRMRKNQASRSFLMNMFHLES